jgi:hypothetical protein
MTKTIVKLASALLATTALLGQTQAHADPQIGKAPPAPTEVNRKPQTGPASQYLEQRYGLSREQAEERLALQDEAAALAGRLRAQPPAGFVDVWIEYEPTYKVVVSFSNNDDRTAFLQSVSPSLRRYVQIKQAHKSKQESDQDLLAVVAALRAAKVEFAAFQDLPNDKLTIEIPDDSKANQIRQLLPPGLRDDVAIRRGLTSMKVDSVYGGWWYALSSTSAQHCSFAFIGRNSRGQESVLTAGHCNTTNPYVWQGDHGVSLGAPYFTRDTIVSSNTYDYSVFLTGTLTTGPLVWIDNDTIYNGSTNTVPGFLDGYLNVTGVKPTAQQLSGYLICKSGYSTGFTCGSITSTAYFDSNYSNVVRVSKSNQPYIAAGGDSGGSAFTYPNGSDTLAAGIVIGATAQPGTTSDPCIKSTAYDCAFFYMPIGRVKDLEPYQIRTTAGYVSPT